MLFQSVEPEIDHLLRGFDVGEQQPCGLVDADIRRLRRQRYGYHELIGVTIVQLGLR
mgnify:CR=1 FL=1